MNINKWNKLNSERKVRRFRDKLLAAELNKTDELIEIISNMISWINNDDAIELEFPNYDIYDEYRIQNLLAKTEAYLNINLREHNLQVKTFDGERNVKKLPIKVFLNGLRSAFNVGSIIRTSEAFGVEEILLEGYTPGIENPKVQQTSMETYKHMKITRVEDGKSELEKLKEKGYKILAFELTNQSILLNEFEINQPCVIMMGNEALGLEKKYIELADSVLEIPLNGWKNSLNVSSAFAIGVYDISIKLGRKE
jgi:tRNA G18 (ribose-2'-O)-methylase SpoU